MNHREEEQPRGIQSCAHALCAELSFLHNYSSPARVCAPCIPEEDMQSTPSSLRLYPTQSSDVSSVQLTEKLQASECESCRSPHLTPWEWGQTAEHCQTVIARIRIPVNDPLRDVMSHNDCELHRRKKSTCGTLVRWLDIPPYNIRLIAAGRPCSMHLQIVPHVLCGNSNKGAMPCLEI